MQTSVIGFPRIGTLRELKFASEKYFKKEIEAGELLQKAQELRKTHWLTQKNAGITYISSNDFSFYDMVLDTAALLGNVPKRYKELNLSELDTYFAMARGYQGTFGDVKALAMKKWFNTNYHYMVPELEDDTVICLADEKPFHLYQEAKAAGVDSFISKPLFRSRLTATLRQFTSGRKEKTARNYLDELSEADYTGKRILLVEDNELNREIAVEILQMTGAEVETAENGKIAVEKVEASPEGLYDLVFMDIQMPVMNGYEATAAIRSLPGEKGKLPIVAMTANAFAEDVQLAKNTGMNGHIAKPLDMNKLNDVLENWL